MLRSSLALFLVITSLAGACVRAPVSRPPASVLVDTLFYISARAREAGRDTDRLADSLEYGLVITARGHGRDPLVDDLGIDILDSLVLTRESFTARLRAGTGPARAPDGFAVVYTHGYGTSLRDAWEHSVTARTRAGGTEPWVVVAWPTVGSGVAWPRNGNPITGAYRRDEAMADSSRAAFAEALEAVHLALGGERMLLVAHSLGGRLAGSVLATDPAVRAWLSREPLRALAFVSPDIDSAHFADALVPAIRPLAHRLLLYASADDRVLALSGFLNDSERAGRVRLADGAPAVAAGLEFVDITDGAVANSAFAHAFGTRHALRRKSAVLFDLVHIVGSRREASCRQALRTAKTLGPDAWQLTSIAVPRPAAAAACTRHAAGE